MISFLLAVAANMGAQDPVAPGQLTVMDKDGRPGLVFPLKRTSVNADIAGLSAKVTVVQTFTNPSKKPIEAVYTFPLGASSAVNRMRINVAGRVIEGSIKRREEARNIYDAARANGQVAALLDQERPNVFTQQVANILPGATVEVEITYVETLKYIGGNFEFSFPMVVGPRYNPSSTPDPEKVSPPTLPPTLRTGANVDLSVHVDAGAPLDVIESQLHSVDVRREGANQAYVTLKNKNEIPNKDFILHYRIKGSGIQEQVFNTPDSDGRGGTFCVILNPPVSPTPTQIRPREVIFVVDQSGSQSGFPLEESKALTLALIETLRPGDTFNVVSFSSVAEQLWDAPKECTPDHLATARNRIQSLTANGSTHFLPAIDMSLSQPPQGGRLRLVVFNTDGFVGNEFEILDRIQKYRRHARMFVFGIGNSVNRFLVDSMAVEGRGGSQVVTLGEQVGPIKKRFIEQTHSPVLTDVKFEVTGVNVEGMTPSEFPDLFAGEPLVLFGRYSAPGRAVLTVTGRLGTESWKRDIPLNLTSQGNAGAGLPSLWARRRIDDLTRQDWLASAKPNHDSSTLVKSVTDLGLQYGLMTPYTSFVAVESKVVNVGGRQVRVQVPVEMADGVNLDGDTLELGRKVNRGGVPGGTGGGGFGASGKPTARTRVQQIQVKHADPTVISELKRWEGHGHQNDEIKAGKIKATVKVDKDVLDSPKKTVDVTVFVTALTDELLSKFKRAGFTVAESDKGLNVVFGSIDKSKLEQLCKIEEVIRVGKL